VTVVDQLEGSWRREPTCSPCPRRRDLADVCSWTSCWPGSWSVQSVRRGPSSHVVTGTGCACTTASELFSTFPWSSMTSPRRPRSSAAEETCVWRGTCRPLREVDRGLSPPRRSAPASNIQWHLGGDEEGQHSGAQEDQPAQPQLSVSFCRATLC